jgi:hypothetical protein
MNTRYERGLLQVGAWAAAFPRLFRLAQGIQQYEGWRPGSVSFRHNNPGNLKRDGSMQVFETALDGLAALCLDLWFKASGKSEVVPYQASLLQAMEVYAPRSDYNDPEAYAAFLASYTDAPRGTATKMTWFLGW